MDIDELAKAIAYEVEAYIEEVQDNLDAAADLYAKELAADIKEDSPVRSGNYKKGWRVQKKGHTRTVYNKNRPDLTYVLEYGCTRRDGSRITPTPHIRDNADRACENFEDLCVNIVAEGVRII